MSYLVARHGFEPGQFLDVGANVGTHVIHAVRSGGLRAGIAVEADPLNHELLSRNVAHNGLEDRIRSLHVPLSDRVGLVTLELSPDNLGDHRIRMATGAVARHRLGGVETPAVTEQYREGARQTVSLVSETLDNLDAEVRLGVGVSTLVWIDTQGHEGHVLQGARGLIAGGRLRYVVAECWPYGLERSGGRERFFDFLARCTAIHDLSSAGWQSAASLALAELRARYAALLTPACEHTDLLCVA